MRDIQPTLSKLIYLGTPAVSGLVLASFFLDPVNLPKMMVLSIFAIPVLMLIATYSWKQLSKSFSFCLVMIFSFVILGILSSVSSEKAFVTTFYGENGRNTGLLTYLCLAILFLGALTFDKLQNFRKLLYGLLGVSLLNIFYSSFVLITGKDPIPWTNPYKTILGTFGNPDFLAAFLGLSIGVFSVFIVSRDTNIRIRLSFVFLAFLSIYLIKETGALQGFMVAAICVLLTALMRIAKSRFKKWNYVFLPGALLSAILAVLGMLQIGPLQTLLYKPSVTYRGEYWQAAWNMAQHSPIMGLGFDSYGDLYRKFRDINALKAPGVDVVTNTAHNVYLDILVGGGFPLFLIYIGIQLLVLIQAINYFRKSSYFDPIFTSLFVAWVGYQAQSGISINQIGLAVWGWVLGGALVAYCHTQVDGDFLGSPQIELKNREKARKKVEVTTPAFSGTIVILGMLAGFMICAPLVTAEASWRHSLETGKLPGIESDIGRFPKSTARYQFGIQHLGGNQLGDLAYKYARDALEFNPNDYQTWRVLIQLPQTTQDEKALARRELHRLDPLNPEWK